MFQDFVVVNFIPLSPFTNIVSVERSAIVAGVWPAKLVNCSRSIIKQDCLHAIQLLQGYYHVFSPIYGLIWICSSGLQALRSGTVRGGAFGGGGGASATSQGGEAADVDATPTEEKKEEKEESDDDMREVYHGDPKGNAHEVQLYNEGVREGAFGFLLNSVLSAKNKTLKARERHTKMLIDAIN